MNMKNNQKPQLLASEEAHFNSILLTMVLPGALFALMMLAVLIAKLLSYLSSS